MKAYHTFRRAVRARTHQRRVFVTSECGHCGRDFRHRADRDVEFCGPACARLAWLNQPAPADPEPLCFGKPARHGRSEGQRIAEGFALLGVGEE